MGMYPIIEFCVCRFTRWKVILNGVTNVYSVLRLHTALTLLVFSILHSHLQLNFWGSFICFSSGFPLVHNFTYHSSFSFFSFPLSGNSFIFYWGVSCNQKLVCQKLSLWKPCALSLIQILKAVCRIRFELYLWYIMAPHLHAVPL